MTLVVSPDQMPDWMRRRARMFQEIDGQLIRGLETPGQGLTLDQLQMFIEHKNPFETNSSQLPAHPRPTILALLHKGDEVEALDGTETIAQATDVFRGYLDPNFGAWGLDQPGRATERQLVSVYEMRKDATFAQMFGSLTDDVRKLVLTQHQIKRFCVKHRDRLRKEGYATFFLFEVELKTGPELFVARAYVDGRKLGALVNRFDCSDVWYAERRPRLVIPELASL